jgi:MFS-type transporter involved in bile tolerance (Atg22 family)
MLAESTPPALHGRAFGFHSAADHLGAMLGSLTAWFVVSQGMAVRNVIGWSAAPGILAVVVLAVVLKGQGAIAERERKRDEKRENAVAALSAPIVMLALLTLFRLPETLLLFRLQQLGVPIATIPLLWAGLHVVRSAASYPAGALNDRIGSSALIGIGAALFAFCLCLLGKPLPIEWAVGVFLLFGLVAACTESSERALIARLSPATLGKGFGTYHALTGLAALPAGLMFGFIYQKSGASDALWLSAALVGMAGVLWLVMHPTTETRTAES